MGLGGQSWHGPKVDKNDCFPAGGVTGELGTSLVMGTEWPGAMGAPM